MNEEICKKCRHCLSCMCGDEFEDCSLRDPKFKKNHGGMTAKRIELIDKAKIVAEIEFLIRPTFTNFDKGVNAAAKALLESIDTLEVKEVDFDVEWKRYFEYRGEMATVNIKHLAKHFFELGLKTKED